MSGPEPDERLQRPCGKDAEAEHERLVALVMKRKGVSREQAEEALRKAEAEQLRMRDA